MQARDMADGDRSGQSGFMGMFLFDQSVPERDGSLENDIVVHENTHGITNRMTGGGTAQYVNILFHTNLIIVYACVSRRRCLQTTEARGLGEGWSDALAE